MISGVVLAAGTASRFGSPKQLVDFEGRPLLQRVIENASSSRLVEVVVVLGYESERIAAAIRLPPGARFIRNSDFRAGQSTSLARGLEAADGGATAAAILLGDQPLVDAPMIDRVIEAFLASEAPLARARFGAVPGHPVIVARSEWAAWGSLDGDAGARRLLDSFPEKVADIQLGPTPSIDVDTWADYQDLLRSE